MAAGLPPYEERVLLSDMETEEDGTGFSQRSAYDELFGTLRAALTELLAKGSKRLLATYLQTLLAYPDGCTRGETVFDPESEELLVQVPPLSEERLYPKEQALVDLVAGERLAGRRVLVYATHTGTRDITERMESILERHGFRAAVMKADAVPPERREAWVAKRVEEGVDVLVCHPPARADGARPGGVPDADLVRDRLQRLHHAAGVASLLAHRADRAPSRSSSWPTGTPSRRTPSRS